VGKAANGSASGVTPIASGWYYPADGESSILEIKGDKKRLLQVTFGFYWSSYMGYIG